MGIVNLKTDLKSLKFGKDRADGGDSGQPYIKNPIDKSILPQSEDFLLRGGLNAPLDAATDMKRLTKWFFDLKSPSGILFTAKQNLLSRTAVATQASGNSSPNSWTKSPLNEGIYTPLSTISQAGIGFLGNHVDKQGLISLTTYTDRIKNIIGKEDGENNRLVDFLNKKQTGTSSGDISDLYHYSGGPGSTLGIGKTHIKFALDRKGSPLRTGVNSGLNFKTYQIGLNNTGTERESLESFQSLIGNPFYNHIKSKGVTKSFLNKSSSFPVGLVEGMVVGTNEIFDNKTGGIKRTFPISVYKKDELKNTYRIEDCGTNTWDQSEIEIHTSLNNYNSIFDVNDPTISDFRKPLLKTYQEENKKDPYSTIMGIAPNYQGPSIDPNDPKSSNKGVSKNIETRIHLGNPGKKGNVYNYTKGKRNKQGEPMGPADKISAMPIYESPNYVTTDIAKNDLVKFRIGALSPNSQKIQFIHFRAFIDSFNDAYGGTWDAVNYMGRGEPFFTYKGFNRSINLSFKVAAQSREELIPMYKKLNFLASLCAPTYSDKGYMGGSLVTLTLGGWLYEQPGFINGLTLDVPSDAPWEIAVPATSKGEDDYNPIYSAKDVKELPHIVSVDGFSFTPIHTFRPAKQSNTYEGVSVGQGKAVSTYGDERYVALKNGHNNNYNKDTYTKTH